jgi:hypothetical protein
MDYGSLASWAVERSMGPERKMSRAGLLLELAHLAPV